MTLCSVTRVPPTPPPPPPRTRRPRQSGKLVLLPAAPILFLVAGGSWFALPHLRSERPDLVTHKVQYEDLQVTVHEHGTLESAHNADIVCKVKARQRGSTVATTLKWIIEDGTPVRRGDLVAELDSSGLEEDIKVQKIAVLKARAEFIQAEENAKIVESQNQGDLASAAVALSLAELDLLKYLQGDYHQKRQEIEGRLNLAESDLDTWRDRAAWTERMVGQGYMTTTQATAENARFRSAQLSLEKVREELRVLEDYTKKRTQTELESKLDEARRAVERVRSQAKAKAIQAEIVMRAKRSIYEHEERRLADLEQQLRNCILTAPQDGLVVHYTSAQSRYGSGAQQGMIAQGEPVREGQRLMQIPDLNHMVVETTLHEAILTQVRGEERQPTGFGDTCQAALAVTPDVATFLVGQFAFDELRDHFRDREERLVYPGQEAVVTLHAFPDLVLHGHVRHVSNVPSQWDWMLADVKVYPTQVGIDDSAEGLKPGMTAEVTILADQPLHHVLTVPVEAVRGAAHRGEHGTCYVLTEHGPEEREVIVGAANDTKVAIQSGLAEGDEVILNTEALQNAKEEPAAP